MRKSIVRPSSTGRGRAAIAACALAAILAALLPLDATTSVPPVRVVGHLATRAPDRDSALESVIVADVPARRLFEVRPDSSAFQNVVLEAYDLDSLGHLRTLVVDAGSRQGAITIPVDEMHHRIFVTYFKPVVPTMPEPWLAVVDARTLRVLSRHRLAEPPLRGGRIYAMSYYAPADKIYIVSEVFSSSLSPGDSGSNTTVLAQWDVGTGATDWTYAVPSCQRPIGTDISGGLAGPVGRSRTSNAVYLGCIVNTPVANYRFPGTPAAVRVTIVPDASQEQTGEFTTETFPIGGDFYAGLFDDGSDRLYMVNKAFGSQGATIFDGRRGVFLGTIALNKVPAGAGIDAETGRAVFVDASPGGGMTVADGRATPLAQGLFFPRVKSGRGQLIVVDSDRRRYFVKYWDGDLDPAKSAAMPYYVIVADEVPTFKPEPAEDPDLNTQNVAERPGVTDVNYAVGAQAFGARSLTVGGHGAVQDNAIGVETGFELRRNLSGIDRLLPVHPQLGDPFTVAPGDRDIYFGRVTKTFLAKNESSARAIAVDRDPNTDGDLFHASHPSGPDPDPGDPGLTREPQDLNKTGTELAWPYQAVECVDFGGKPARIAPEERNFGRAGVECAQSKAVVSAEASFEGSLPGGVSFAYAFATSRATRDPSRGALGTAFAETWGIRIGEFLHVDRVATLAETKARGRPGTARGRFERSVEGIRIADPRDPGSLLFSCSLADECRERLGEAAQVLNAVTGGRIRMLFPEPDRALTRGTEGGYEALVRKDVNSFLEDKATNNDERFEVPGMVVVIFDDGHSRSRQILQFAAVEAESHYGIFVLPTFGEPLVLPPVGLQGQPPPASVSSSPSGSRETAVLGTQYVRKRFRDGYVLGVSSPRNFLLGVTVWAFFAAPIYLAIRRRQALGRGGLPW